MGLGHFLVAFEDHFACVFVNDICRDNALDRVFSNDVFRGDLNPIHPGLTHPANSGRGELLVFLDEDLAVGSLDFLGAALADEEFGHGLLEYLATVDFDLFGDIEEGKDLFRRVAERLQENRHVNLAAAIDAREEQVLVIEFKVEPGTAVRNDAAGIDLLARSTDRGGQG